MPSRSIRTNWMHKTKRTADTFVCKDMFTNITRSVSVKCPKRIRREAISQKKENLPSHKHIFTKQICFALNENMPTRSSHIEFDSPTPVQCHLQVRVPSNIVFGRDVFLSRQRTSNSNLLTVFFFLKIELYLLHFIPYQNLIVDLESNFKSLRIYEINHDILKYRTARKWSSLIKMRLPQ